MSHEQKPFSPSSSLLLLLLLSDGQRFLHLQSRVRTVWLLVAVFHGVRLVGVVGSLLPGHHPQQPGHDGDEEDEHHADDPCRGQVTCSGPRLFKTLKDNDLPPTKGATSPSPVATPERNKTPINTRMNFKIGVIRGANTLALMLIFYGIINDLNFPGLVRAGGRSTAISVFWTFSL